MYEPRKRQVRPRAMTRVMMVQVKPTSELLGLEHGDAQVDEHHDSDAEEDTLGPGHTRSKAQMRPSITRTKPMIPSTARKSAMEPVSAVCPEQVLNRSPWA